MAFERQNANRTKRSGLPSWHVKKNACKRTQYAIYIYTVCLLKRAFHVVAGDLRLSVQCPTENHSGALQVFKKALRMKRRAIRAEKVPNEVQIRQ